MKLIANGDDFGITKACNYALIECYKDGIMKSTSMMTNMPGASHAASLMKENPGLSVGIHFNLTVGKPLTNCPTLVKEDGTFNKGNLKESSHVKIEEIRQELQAQFDKYVELTGQLPDHLNSHHGICLIQGGEEVVLEFSKKYDLPIREFFTMKSGKCKAETVYEIAPMVGFKMDGSYNTPEDLINTFTQDMLDSDNIYEYVLHPGYVDYELLQFSSLTEGRCYDAYVYLSEKVKTWMKDNNVESVSYKELKHK